MYIVFYRGSFTYKTRGFTSTEYCVYIVQFLFLVYTHTHTQVYYVCVRSWVRVYKEAIFLGGDLLNRTSRKPKDCTRIVPKYCSKTDFSQDRHRENRSSKGTLLRRRAALLSF